MAPDPAPDPAADLAADLVARWDDLDHDLAARWGLPAAPHHRDELLGRWHEPHRRYHDVAHLAAVLGHLDRWTGDGRDRDAARVAAWYHDAVQQPGAGDDEARAADLARAHLADRGAPAELVDTVVAAVLATADHLRDPDADPPPAVAVLLDADLAVLGADPDTYAAYRRGVRAEWPHLDDATFARGRRTVVTALAARRRLYLTEVAARERGAAARENLTAELVDLSS